MKDEKRVISILSMPARRLTSPKFKHFFETQDLSGRLAIHLMLREVSREPDEVVNRALAAAQAFNLPVWAGLCDTLDCPGMERFAGVVLYGLALTPEKIAEFTHRFPQQPFIFGVESLEAFARLKDSWAAAKSGNCQAVILGTSYLTDTPSLYATLPHRAYQSIVRTATRYLHQEGVKVISTGGHCCYDRTGEGERWGKGDKSPAYTLKNGLYMARHAQVDGGILQYYFQLPLVAALADEHPNYHANEKATSF